MPIAIRLRRQALWLLVLLAAAPGRAEVLPSAQRKPAPDFALSDSTGRSMRLSDSKGRVVLLNFWATWCHGCKEELPWLMEYERAYQDRGLSVIGLSTDADGWKSVKPFLRKQPLNYPVAIAGTDVAKTYALEAMPTSVLIDRDGRIAATYVGVVNRAACEKDLQALLKEPGPRP